MQLPSPHWDSGITFPHVPAELGGSEKGGFDRSRKVPGERMTVPVEPQT